MTSEPLLTEQSPKKRALLSVLLPTAILLVIAWGGLVFMKSTVVPKDKGSFDVRVGAELPDLTFHRLDGSTYRLSDSRSKVILINFWATWCEACMEEMPSLVRLYDTYQSKGLEVIGVNLDEDQAKAIASTTEEFQIRFVNFVDRDDTLGKSFDVHAIPLTVTLDSSRRILEIQPGDRDWMSPKYLEKLEAWLSRPSS